MRSSKLLLDSVEKSWKLMKTPENARVLGLHDQWHDNMFWSIPFCTFHLIHLPDMDSIPMYHHVPMMVDIIKSPWFELIVHRFSHCYNGLTTGLISSTIPKHHWYRNGFKHMKYPNMLNNQKTLMNVSDNRVSINGGTPKSSILMGCSLINHPLLRYPIYGNPHMW